MSGRLLIRTDGDLVEVKSPGKGLIPMGSMDLYNELCSLIERSNKTAVSKANSVLTCLFWEMGRRIRDHLLDNKRADYGKQIVASLSRQLQDGYGRNFEEKNLRRMMQFSAVFPDQEQVMALAGHLSWSHLLIIIPLKNAEQRLFYASYAAREGLGVRVLRKMIKLKTWERTVLANLQLPGETLWD